MRKSVVACRRPTSKPWRNENADVTGSTRFCTRSGRAGRRSKLRLLSSRDRVLDVGSMRNGWSGGLPPQVGGPFPCGAAAHAKIRLPARVSACAKTRAEPPRVTATRPSWSRRIIQGRSAEPSDARVRSASPGGAGDRSQIFRRIFCAPAAGAAGQGQCRAGGAGGLG
eukprot:scaffold141_cov410-Prasinococcus_capsulatus_cf.AAC.1